jgi:hypothetical protein
VNAVRYEKRPWPCVRAGQANRSSARWPTATPRGAARRGAARNLSHRHRIDDQARTVEVVDIDYRADIYRR